MILECGKEKLKYDLAPGPNDIGDRNSHQPQVKIFGAGRLTLLHISIYRDIHYIGDRTLRAGTGKAFTLSVDEFFVLGDNSPYSFDGRLWATEGIGNNNVKYRIGTVPRDYLVGKAFFIYWADAAKPFENLLPIIPNISKIRFIANGSNEQM